MVELSESLLYCYGVTLMTLAIIPSNILLVRPVFATRIAGICGGVALLLRCLYALAFVTSIAARWLSAHLCFLNAIGETLRKGWLLLA
jgi:hypothetical protein